MFCRVFEDLSLKVLDIYYFKEAGTDSSVKEIKTIVAHTSGTEPSGNEERSGSSLNDVEIVDANIRTTQTSGPSTRNKRTNTDSEPGTPKVKIGKVKIGKARQSWTREMLLTQSMNWGNKSPFVIAVEATNRKFIAHVASWTNIREIWRYGNLDEVV